MQGPRSVDEYFQEMEMCLLRTGITEDEESIISWFLVGLNKPIADKVDMTNYTNLTELVHFAKRAERQLAQSYKSHVSEAGKSKKVGHQIENSSPRLNLDVKVPMKPKQVSESEDNRNTRNDNNEATHTELDEGKDSDTNNNLRAETPGMQRICFQLVFWSASAYTH